MRWLCLAAMMAMTGPATANVLFGDPFGTAAARTKDPQVFDDHMRMAARVVFEGTGELAAEVPKPARINLEMGITTSKGVAADDVRLRSKVYFVNPKNNISRKAKDVICFEGSVPWQWVAMDPDMIFRQVATDLHGTSGVRVEVKDELSGSEKYFMPTHNWQGVQK